MVAPTARVFDPFAALNTDNPYPTYRWLLAEQPVYHNPDRDFWAVSRFADVQRVLKDPVTFSSAAGVRIDDLLALAGPSPLTMDPPRHGLLRNIVRPYFAPRAIKTALASVERNTVRVLDELDGQEQFDAAQEFAKRIPVAVICDLLGVPSRDASMLKRWADSMLETVPDEVGSTAAAREAAASTRDYWLSLLAERAQRPTDDILSAVSSAEVEGLPLDADEKVGMCNLVFEAGNATTGALISNALLALATDESQMTWLSANPDKLPQAIEEILRWDSPVQGLMRTTTDHVTLHGRTIPPSSKVLLVLGAANRDPSVWDDPDQLDLSRVPLRNLAFGEGLHFCLGAPLARLEAPVALRHFLARYPDFAVVGLDRFHDVSMRTLKSLVVRVDYG